MTSRLSHLYSASRDRHLKNDRLKKAKRYFLYKRAQQLPLSASQRNEITDYWKQYVDVSNQLHWFAFYNRFCEDKYLLHL